MVNKRQTIRLLAVGTLLLSFFYLFYTLCFGCSKNFTITIFKDSKLLIDGFNDPKGKRSIQDEKEKNIKDDSFSRWIYELKNIEQKGLQFKISPKNEAEHNKEPEHTNNILSVYGCFASGIKAIHSVIEESLNQKIGLNALSSNGTVSWALKPLGSPSHTRVIRVIKHPIFVIRNLKKEFCGLTDEETPLKREKCYSHLKKVTQWKEIKNEFSISDDKSIEMAFLEYWVKWNMKFEALFPDSELVHFESLHPRKFEQVFNLNYSTSQPLVQIDYWRTSLSFEDLEMKQPDNQVIQQAIMLMNKYFYVKETPRLVTVFGYRAPDQPRYLIEYLWTLDFSSSRPLRFIFDLYNGTTFNTDIMLLNRKKQLMVIFGDIRNDTGFELMRAMNEVKHAMIILHKDEYCRFDTTLVYPKHLLAYRGYYDSSYVDNQKVFWYPVGVRYVFPHIYNQVMASQRENLCNFMGSMTSHSRLQLSNVLQGLPDKTKCFFFGIEEWSLNFTNYLSPVEYQQILSQSVFTLSPIGHNPECYRIYEACEAGSIPIIEDIASEPLEVDGITHYCNQSLAMFRQSGAPFIYVRNWSELPKILEYYQSNLEQLNKKQQELLTWYSSFKSNFIIQFEENLNKVASHVQLNLHDNKIILHP